MTRTRKSILIVLGILATLATGALLFTSCGSTSSTTAADDSSQTALTNFTLNCGASACVN